MRARLCVCVRARVLSISRPCIGDGEKDCRAVLPIRVTGVCRCVDTCRCAYTFYIGAARETLFVCTCHRCAAGLCVCARACVGCVVIVETCSASDLHCGSVCVVNGAVCHVSVQTYIRIHIHPCTTKGLPFGFQTKALPVFLRSQNVSLTNIGTSCHHATLRLSAALPSYVGCCT